MMHAGVVSRLALEREFSNTTEEASFPLEATREFRARAVEKR